MSCRLDSVKRAALPSTTSLSDLGILGQHRLHAAIPIPFRLLRFGLGTRCPNHRMSS